MSVDTCIASLPRTLQQVVRQAKNLEDFVNSFCKGTIISANRIARCPAAIRIVVHSHLSNAVKVVSLVSLYFFYPSILVLVEGFGPRYNSKLMNRNRLNLVPVSLPGSSQHVLSIRPKVNSLAFNVFARSIHPELFQVFRTLHIDRENFQARIDITRDGHVVTFNSNTVTLSEIACSSQQLLPQRRRLLCEQLKSKAKETIEAPKGILYQTEFEMEHVGPDLFAMMQSELGGRQKELDLLHIFDSSGRIAMGAISFIHVDARPCSLIVQSLHTFPDDHAIVKVFSTFSLPKSN